MNGGGVNDSYMLVEGNVDVKQVANVHVLCQV